MEILTAERRGAGRGAQKVNRRRERLFYTGTAVVFVLVISHPLRLVVGNTQSRSRRG